MLLFMNTVSQHSGIPSLIPCSQFIWSWVQLHRWRDIASSLPWEDFLASALLVIQAQSAISRFVMPWASEVADELCGPTEAGFLDMWCLQGADPSHPDLNVVEFIDLVDSPGSPLYNKDGNGHGAWLYLSGT
jgi:hypothetical protein